MAAVAWDRCRLRTASAGAVLIARIAARPIAESLAPADRHLRREIAEGIRWLWHRPTGLSPGAHDLLQRHRGRDVGVRPAREGAARPRQLRLRTADHGRCDRWLIGLMAYLIALSGVRTGHADGGGGFARMRQSRHDARELSPSEAARRIGATTRTVQRWIATGRLPARRVGGRWRVASDALDAFIARDHLRRPRPQRRGAIRGGDGPDPPPVRRQSRRDRPADQPNRRPARHHRDRARHRRPRPGSTCSTSGRSSVRRGRPAPTPSIPGFGFLAENAEFAEAVIEAGHPLGRAAAGGDPGHGRQGGGATPRAGSASRRRARLRRAGPVRRGSAPPQPARSACRSS